MHERSELEENSVEYEINMDAFENIEPDLCKSNQILKKKVKVMKNEEAQENKNTKSGDKVFEHNEIQVEQDDEEDEDDIWLCTRCKKTNSIIPGDPKSAICLYCKQKNMLVEMALVSMMPKEEEKKVAE